MEKLKLTFEQFKQHLKSIRDAALEPTGIGRPNPQSNRQRRLAARQAKQAARPACGSHRYRYTHDLGYRNEMDKGRKVRMLRAAKRQAAPIRRGRA